jgi:30S ribosomal protein S31
MGKGDKKTKKGKITIGSHGVSRPTKKKLAAAKRAKVAAAPKKIKAAPKKAGRKTPK